MQASKAIRISILLSLGIFLVACGGQSATRPDDSPDLSGRDGPGSSQTGIGDRSSGELDEFGSDDRLGRRPEDFIIYFEFDKSEILDEYGDVLTQHAFYLADNAQIQVRLEGHTDERGTREYNIGLGERRSQAVRQTLMIQGVAASQITTVSFGEERPAREGSNENAYARNRRVEIVYQ